MPQAPHLTTCLEIYRAMVTARQIDRVEEELVSRGEAFFHVSGAGHEASAALVPFLTEHDWLHCHYRDKAMMVAHGVTPTDFLDALVCNARSHSRGRQMSAHMSNRDLKVMSIVGAVGSSALQAAGVAAVVKADPSESIVLCSIGDGATQQGEFLEACAEAARSELPVLFLVEDNRWAISTSTTERTFYSLPHCEPTEFHGIPIHRLNGRDALAAHDLFGSLVGQMRKNRAPAIVVMDVERLANHTNADDQTLYRSAEEIERARAHGDPITIFADYLIERGCKAEQLEEIHAAAVAEVAEAETAALSSEANPPTVHDAKAPLPVELTHPAREQRGGEEGATVTMRDAIREVLRNHLHSDPRVTLYGEDIADPKGDVFGVTKGLSTQFAGRVNNSPLSESTIVGISGGRALAGERPVAFLQFADFLPLAYNQLVSELGSMFWRSDGDWTAPVIVMAACGAFRPGLGPFHAQTYESMMSHTPGIDVFMPSTAADAAGMLNAAFQSGRPTIFFYPKSALNDTSVATTPDVERQFVPIGPARKVRSGRDITLVGWGNTVKICEQTAAALEQAGVESEILDLRSLSPWDERAVLASAEKTARMVVAHEDNHTCGIGAEVLATIAEKARVPVAMRRVTRADTLVPCNFENQLELLPSVKRVVAAAAELLDLNVTWETPAAEEAGIGYVDAVGSGPSDESVFVAELFVQAGDVIERGQEVASLEASKGVFELTTPIAGRVLEVIGGEGATVDVGAPILKLSVEQQAGRAASLLRRKPAKPVIERKSATSLRVPRRLEMPRRFRVGMSTIASVEGSRTITNEDLFRCTAGLEASGMTPADIVRRTGIEQRHWVAEGENATDMAVRASWRLLDQVNLLPADLDLIICSTTSPNSVTPSMACQVLSGLAGDKTDAMLQAYDINAACSGYLYALQAGYDYLQSTPQGRVLVVTAEVLSPLLDHGDFDTAILFGDACSATVLYGEDHFHAARAELFRPELSAKGDRQSTLSVPLTHDGFIQMNGRRVFSEAVRSMVNSMKRVCQNEGMGVGDLKMVVPHQANQRIVESIEGRIDTSVYSNIRQHGNTSSTSIPLCLQEVLPVAESGDLFGLCAFGGGFTFGASLLRAA